MIIHNTSEHDLAEDLKLIMNENNEESSKFLNTALNFQLMLQASTEKYQNPNPSENKELPETILKGDLIDK